VSTRQVPVPSEGVGHNGAMTLAAKAPEERRRRILAAAVDVLRDRGFSGTRVADIAAAAGTSPALVLYHFSSLDDVLLAALTSVDDEFYAELATTEGGDPRDRLVQLAALAGVGGPAFGDWQLWLEVWVRARHDARVDEVRRALDARWRGSIRDVIDAGSADGVFRSKDPSRSALRLASLMDGLAVQAVLDEAGLSPDQLTEVWLDGAAMELGADAADLEQRLNALRG
jgi:AcrR family transcriptional regulator